MFHLQNFNLWQAEHCTLHTVKCTLRTAPAPANASESEGVHFILHIAHCTVSVHCTPSTFVLWKFSFTIIITFLNL